MSDLAILEQLAFDAGIVMPECKGFYKDNLPVKNFGMATDAQPSLITAGNSSIPAYLANYIDPRVVEVLVSPMKAAVIAGEEKAGSWTDATWQFNMVESTGETSAYGDFNTNGMSGANMNFIFRQSFHYQTVTQWGEKELEMAGLTRIDWATRLNIASVLTLNKYQNKTYFFGVDGLENYGLLNDPNLPSPLSATATWSSATVEQIYEDVRRMVQEIISTSKGLVDDESPFVMAMSPAVMSTLNRINIYGLTPKANLAANYPQMRFETAPEYATGSEASGQFVQMFVEELNGQKTCTTAFTEKMRTHPIIIALSSFMQKKSQGTWGTVIFRPFLFTSMIGV
jgi:hypothetical protein